MDEEVSSLNQPSTSPHQNFILESSKQDNLQIYTDVNIKLNNNDCIQNIHRKENEKRDHKSKIVASDGDGEQLYCICRTSDTTRFMICCDHCEEWFHGDCVKITQSFSKKIQIYYCPLCQEKDNSLEIKLKESQRTKKIKNEENEDIEFVNEKENNLLYDKFQQKKVIESEDEKDNYSPDDEDDEDDDDEFKVKRLDNHGPRRSRGRPKKLNDKAKNIGKQRGRKKGQSTKTKETKSKSKGHRKNVDKKSHTHHRRSRHKITYSEDSQDEAKANIVRHCYGPECIYAARKGSKYCSDECGVRLATNRMLEILPQRIQEWRNMPCAADHLSWKELEEIRREQNNATSILADIDRKQFELEAIVAQGKSCTPFSEEESAAIVDNEPDTDCVIHCVTCSQEVSLKIVR